MAARSGQKGQFKKGNEIGKETRFSSERQPSYEGRIRGWVRSVVKERIIQEVYSQVLEHLENREYTKQELIALFKPAIDISGDKTEKQEIELPKQLQINVIKKD